VLGDIHGVEPRHVGCPDVRGGCGGEVDALYAGAELLDQAELPCLDGLGIQSRPQRNDYVDRVVADTLANA
jgi:hypothetical protein